jgi:FHS family L-fucose permease-like MFS transporter
MIGRFGASALRRFGASALMARISPRKLLASFAAINVLLVATTMLSRGNTAMFSIIVFYGLSGSRVRSRKS